MSSLALSRITSIASGSWGTVKAGTLGFRNREDIISSEDKTKKMKAGGRGGFQLDNWKQKYYTKKPISIEINVQV